MDERIAMFREFDTGAYTVVEMCCRYGISRDTFYVWKRRRESGEERWFEEHSRAPGTCPHATGKKPVAAVIAMRRKFPRFGPKKILAKLEERWPELSWPSVSTIGDILKREGLIDERPRRRKAIDLGEAVAGPEAVNGEWAIDFKGWFRTLDGKRCDPLTITDTASRYLIAARIVDPAWAGVRCAMERVFEEFGLPLAIRSDNGAPFGSIGAGGLSALSVWWLKLGIEPRYIPPSSPQHNGRHERMHRTLKAETARPPAATPLEQQTLIDGFRKHYNEERPHEALGQKPPAKLWTPSPRRFPVQIEDAVYDARHEVRRVRHTGQIKWRNGYVFIGEALTGELVGLEELENGNHIVRFMNRDLGVVDGGLRFHRFAPPRARLRSTLETERRTE